MSKEKISRGRYWTPEELEEFSNFLLDEKNCFAANLDTLAFKNLLIMKCFPSLGRLLIKKLKQLILLKTM